MPRPTPFLNAAATQARRAHLPHLPHLPHQPHQPHTTAAVHAAASPWRAKAPPAARAGLAWMASIAFVALAVAPLQPAVAAPLQFDPFSGQGNVSVFDASAGTGGWVGSLDGLTDPRTGLPLAAVSTVLFTLDRLTSMVSGQFEFTTTDLSSTLAGLVQGTVSDAAILTDGGQFSLDYRITTSTGWFAGASGYGLSFLTFDPGAAPGSDNYSESGVMVYAVPEPAALALALLALAAMAGVARPRMARSARQAPLSR